MMIDFSLREWFFFVALPISLIFHFFVLRPFFKGNLPHPIARWIGRILHYPKLPFVLASFTLGLRKSSYWSKIDDYVMLGALPTKWHASMLRENKIKAVINMCDEDSGPLSIYKEMGIEQLYLPTIDHTEPTYENMKQAIPFIEKYVDNEETVLIHCMAGRGRSAAVAMCWMVHRHKELDLEKAQQLILSKRPLVRKSLYKQPSVLQFYSQLQK